jgi:hypothetical protein
LIPEIVEGSKPTIPFDWIVNVSGPDALFKGVETFTLSLNCEVALLVGLAAEDAVIGAEGILGPVQPEFPGDGREGLSLFTEPKGLSIELNAR